MQRKLQEFLLVLPFHLAFRKFLAVRRRWRRIGDLRDQISCRCFCDTVDQDSEQRDLEEDVEADAEAKQYTLPIMEPLLFLLFAEPYTREVGFELCSLLATPLATQ